MQTQKWSLNGYVNLCHTWKSQRWQASAAASKHGTPRTRGQKASATNSKTATAASENTLGRIATMNLLLKKAVIEEVGGWDENLPSQYDTDLGFRVSAKGYRIAYEPSACLLPLQQANAQRLLSSSSGSTAKTRLNCTLSMADWRKATKSRISA